MKLWLDDERPAPAGWDLALTAWEAIGLLILAGLRCEPVEAISLDHDLGPTVDDKGRELSDSPGTGMDVLNWMLDVDLVPDNTSFHTANGPARENMLSKLSSWRKAKELPSDTLDGSDTFPKYHARMQ